MGFTCENSAPYEGTCNKEDKVIVVGKIPESENQLLLIIIHGVCHAAATLAHGKNFKQKMFKCAKRAQELGRPALADLIAQDLKRYKTDQTLSASDVNERLAGCVQETGHQGRKLGYGVMIGALGSEYGLYPEELERRYKRCRRVYDQTKKQAELSVKMQKRGER